MARINKDIELVVLTSLAFSPGLPGKLYSEGLRPEWFGVPVHGWIAEAIFETVQAGQIPEFQVLQDRMKRKGHDPKDTYAIFRSIQEQVVTSGVVLDEHLAILKREYELREMIRICQRHMIKANDYDGEDAGELMQGMLSDVLELGRDRRSSRRYTAAEGVRKLRDLVQRIRDGDAPGIDPMLPSMKAAFWAGRMPPKSINLIGANPGVGKSMLLLSIAAWNAARGKRVVYIGSEMPIELLMVRLAPMLAERLELEQITSRGLETGEASDEILAWMEKEVAERIGENLIMFDSITQLEEYLADVAAENAALEIDLLVLDYIQALGTSKVIKGGLWVVEEYISERIRMSTQNKEANYVLLAASSFLKGDPTKRPGQESFRGAGKMLHDWHSMWALWYNKEMDKQLCLINVKMRSPSSSWAGASPIPLLFDQSGMVREEAIDSSGRYSL